MTATVAVLRVILHCLRRQLVMYRCTVYTAALHRVMTRVQQGLPCPPPNWRTEERSACACLPFPDLSSFLFVRTSACCCANLNIGLTCMSQYRERPPSRRGSPHCSPPNMKLVCMYCELQY